MRTTEAWVLHAGDAGNTGPASLRREEFPIGEIGPNDVLVEPIYGSWEANMSHALSRSPIDVPRARREEKIVLGNSGLVRVVERGSTVTHIREGDLCIIGNGARYDRFGFPEQVWGYDWPGSMGFLARQSRVTADILLPIPAATRFSALQWAAFGVRYATAFDNWHVASQCWRSQITVEDLPQSHVWGWGGGTSLGGVHLASVLGHRAVMITSNDRRKQQLTELGIATVDRRLFPNLACDEKKFMADADYRRAFKTSDDAFFAQVQALTDGLGVSIFFDFLGSPLIRTTLRALGREGVLTTAGWKEGMSITSMRAIECIRRHLHVHTHYARRGRIGLAMQFAEETGWMNPIQEEDRVWGWEEIPELADSFEHGRIDSYFPLYQVNPL